MSQPIPPPHAMPPRRPGTPPPGVPPHSQAPQAAPAPFTPPPPSGGMMNPLGAHGAAAPPLAATGLAAPSPASLFPSTNPDVMGHLVGGAITPVQQNDLAAFLGQQQQAAMLGLVDALRNQPNPAAAAAQTAPGYPTPPSPGGAY